MKEVKDFIKKTSKTDRGKGIWFFVAFGFLLLILMIISRTTTHYPLEDQLNGIRNANNKKNGAKFMTFYTGMTNHARFIYLGAGFKVCQSFCYMEKKI